jgi:hypothetical protein
VINHKFCQQHLPDAVAVYVAQVPPTNHVPPLIKQPVCVPPVNPFRYPDPDKVPGLPLAEMLEVVFVTDINVVLGEEVLLMEVLVVLEVLGTTWVVEVLGKAEVLEIVEVLGATELLPAAEELGGGAGLPDLGRY